jgi:hypothetical protein
MLGASSGSTVGISVGFAVLAYILFAFAFVGIFKKANQPVWGAFVPIVNWYFLLKTVGRPGWWLILFFIPCLGFIIYLIVLYDLSTSFGHGLGFFFGLWFL